MQSTGQAKVTLPPLPLHEGQTGSLNLLPIQNHQLAGGFPKCAHFKDQGELSY
jgi:hypothetical protein